MKVQLKDSDQIKNLVLEALGTEEVQQHLKGLITEVVENMADNTSIPFETGVPIKEEESFLDRVKRHEGEMKDPNGRHKPYKCPAGFWTTGWGHNLEANHPGEWQDLITQHFDDVTCEEWLEDDLEAAEARCRSTSRRYGCDWEEFPIDVKEALTEMAFQMGNTRNWRKMWTALSDGEWTSAAYHALDSKWAKHDSPNRAMETAHFLSNREVMFSKDLDPEGGPATFTARAVQGRPVAHG